MISADEILASDVWKEAVTTIDSRLWDAFTRVDPGDEDKLRDLAYRREALKLIQNQLADLMKRKRSINLQGRP